MRPPLPLPAQLPRVFAVADGIAHGVGRQRLRGRTLESPFYGVRSQAADWEFSADPWQRQSEQRRIRALDYAPRLRPDTFYSHETAAALWGAPLPLVSDHGYPADGRRLPLHVSVLGAGAVPAGRGVAGHRADERTTGTTSVQELQVADAASTWASLARTLSVHDLVAAGDYFCRQWREGVGRPDVGKQPLTTIEQLRARVDAGRRVGIRKLRSALELIREDSWSPMESKVRCILGEAGLPEPELNIDVFDHGGRWLGCFDLVYRERRVAIEYNGTFHAGQYARDVERIAALRAAGWQVIEVTAELVRNPAALVARVRRALAGV